MNHDRNERLMAIAKRHLVQNYKQQPMVLARGEGCEVWDVEGKRYLDMTSGIAVSCLGHAHPKLTSAIALQAGRLIHASNLYFAETNLILAEALAERSFGGRVFFCNSGGEANEAAIKLARRYQQVVAQRPDKVAIISTEGSFHGRTIATVSLTGQEKYRKNFGPMFGPVRFVPFGDLEALKAALADGQAAAFLCEPVQAEGGVVTAPPGYFAAAKEACVQTGTMLILDEVQTGIGRTGSWFGYQQENVVPDVMTLAKGLAGGVPIGAMVATDEAARGFVPLPGEPPPHASTFGGNPLACAAALAVLDVIEEEALLDNTRQAGDYLGRGLGKLVVEHGHIATGTRGRGLLRGLVVKQDAVGIVGKCREKGLLLSVAGGNVLRFVPPLIVKRHDLDEAISILGDVLRS
jgi:acetylornithine/N-succinyldiaminopimelate aminotransferase